MFLAPGEVTSVPRTWGCVLPPDEVSIRVTDQGWQPPASVIMSYEPEHERSLPSANMPKCCAPEVVESPPFLSSSSWEFC